MINDALIAEIEAYVEDNLKEDSFRLSHIKNVKKAAIRLGSVYHADIPSLIVASYLHDAVKNVEIEDFDIATSMIYDEDIPAACRHAYMAAFIAERKFGITNIDILNAIRYHCTGRKEMSLVEKIIFVSDFIEEGRDFVSDSLRDLAEDSLDKAVLEVLIQKKQYILSQGEKFSKTAEKAIKYYLSEREGLNV